MELIVDLHLHSHYSRATSRNCNVEELYRFGKLKGINIIGSGDFTHPQWFLELKNKLEPAEPGLYKLKNPLEKELKRSLPASVRDNFLRFILTVEISTIYSKNGKIRKIHQLIIVPSLEVASQLNSQLERIGNLQTDGRPILGLDSKKLLKIALDTHSEIMFIPAHIWTPWFSVFGSKSGFDSLEEAFEELTPLIKAVETGLSSDPFMNWRLQELQKLTIISNSDAHSPQKLGREATLLNCQTTYSEIVSAIKSNDDRIVGTIEFFPEEGKYHFDGHRKCKVRFSPTETKKHLGICPVCHQKLTVGVDYRVSELADYPENYRPEKHKKVEYIIPLSEILAAIYHKATQTQLIQTEYEKIISALGNEFDLLRKVAIKDIKKLSPVLAGLIEQMRRGDISVEPGYDGEYGKISFLINKKSPVQQPINQLTLDW